MEVLTLNLCGSTSSDIETMLLYVLANPSDYEAYLLVADSYEDANLLQTAAVYRWMHKHSKHPSYSLQHAIIRDFRVENVKYHWIYGKWEHFCVLEERICEEMRIILYKDYNSWVDAVSDLCSALHRLGDI